MYNDYICDDCGFTSQEHPGAYKCPKCGNKMRIANTKQYGGDSTRGYGKWVIYVIELIILLPICFATFGVLGIPIFIILFIIIRHFLNKSIRNQAIKINDD